MKTIIRLAPLFLLSLYFAPNAYAGWSCDATFLKVTPEQCEAAGSQSTPEAFASTYLKAQEKKYPDRVPYTLDACIASGDDYSCRYSFYIGTSKLNGTVMVMQDSPSVSCPETLESRGDDSSVVKIGDKYNVVWSVRQVTDDICHSSCSYLASSASVSTCYRVAGSSDTGFCNFVVGLNSASPSCTSESGYKAPATGDSLSPGTGTGGGGDDGGDGGTGGDGGSGGDGGTGGSGGDGDGDESDGSGFDGELDFDDPGKLDAKEVFEDEKNKSSYGSFVIQLEASYNESEFGRSVNQLKQTLLTTGTGAACPTPVVQLYFTTFTIDSHCQIYNNSDLASIFTTVFMAAWALLALRIVLSA